MLLFAFTFKVPSKTRDVFTPISNAPILEVVPAAIETISPVFVFVSERASFWYVSPFLRFTELLNSILNTPVEVSDPPHPFSVRFSVEFIALEKS